jgi:hypothetical protein
MEPELSFGLCQGYMGLQYHMEDALLEANQDISIASSCPPVALFSKKYYTEINELTRDKVHDFCFIGSMNPLHNNRQWLIEFAQKYFTTKSVFINTDQDPNWVSLGSFDYSHANLGFCPRLQPDNQSRNTQYRIVAENLFYFETLRKSKYALCPIGDTYWSFRFYETLMCKTIPMVTSWHHTYRTKEESKINYKYIRLDTSEEGRPGGYNIHVTSDADNYALVSTTEPREIESYDDIVKHNSLIFEEFHLLK